MNADYPEGDLESMMMKLTGSLSDETSDYDEEQGGSKPNQSKGNVIHPSSDACDRNIGLQLT